MYSWAMETGWIRRVGIPCIDDTMHYRYTYLLPVSVSSPHSSCCLSQSDSTILIHTYDGPAKYKPIMVKLTTKKRGIILIPYEEQTNATAHIPSPDNSSFIALQRTQSIRCTWSRTRQSRCER